MDWLAIAKLALTIVSAAATEADKLLPAADKTAHKAINVAASILNVIEGSL